MNPKPNKKLSLGAGSYVTIASTGFFTQSRVILSSIAYLFPSLINPQAAFAFRGHVVRWVSHQVKESWIVWSLDSTPIDSAFLVNGTCIPDSNR